MRRELGEDLATCTARHGRPDSVGYQHESLEAPTSCGNGGEDGGALGAASQAEGTVLHIAANEDLAICGKEGGANAELG